MTIKDLIDRARTPAFMARLRRRVVEDKPILDALDANPVPQWVTPATSRLSLTTDRNDPRLSHGVDEQPVDQAPAYLVLSDEERARGFVRPVRRAYVHLLSRGGCGAVTTMGQAIAETYARDPSFYGATYCVGCSKHRPVGADGEFAWDGPYEPNGEPTELVGT